MATDTERGATGNVQAEIDKYVLLLTKDPNSRVFAPLAEAYRKAGLLEEAIQTAQDGLKVHPNYLSGRVALGRAYYEKKMLAEAREEFQKVVKSAPDNLMAHKVLGQIAYDQSDLPSALKSFEMVVLLDPRDQEAKLFLEKLGGGTRAAAPPPFVAAPPPAPPPPPPAAPPVTAPPPFMAPPPIAPPAAAPVVPPPITAPPPLMAPPPPPPLPPAEHPPLPQEAPMPELSMEELAIEEAPPELAAFPAPEELAEPVRSPAPESSLEPFTEDAADAALVAEEPVLAAEAPAPAAAPPIEDLPLEVFSRETGTESVPEAGLALERTAYEEFEPAVPAEPAERFDVDQTSFDLTPEMEAPVDEGPPIALEPTAYDASAAAEAPAEEESPFEVFGRPKRIPPPVSTKGEEPMREIDLEATAYEPVAEEPESEDSSPFEVFTRDPRVEPRAATPRESRGEGGTFRDLDLEAVEGRSASRVEKPSPADATELPLEPAASWVGQSEAWIGSPPSGEPVSLDEEIPSIDLTREVEMIEGEAPAPPPFPEPPVLEGGEAWSAEPAIGAAAEAEVEEKPVAIEDAFEDFGVEEPGEPPPVQLEEEIPSIDLGTEMALAGPEGEPEAEPDAEGRGAAGRGVFDTETLASIYVSQGFYGRAAEIYQRLVQERPGDAGLQQKLAELQALDRGAGAPQAAAAAPEPAPAEAPSPAAARPPRPAPPPVPGTAARKDNETIRRLQVLLDGLKGGRPT